MPASQSVEAESPESLGARATRGTLWVLAGRIASQFIRLFSNLALTRLLFPEAFGLVALVNTLLIGLAMASDLGIHVSLVQNEREDPDFLDTVWTLQAVRGFAIAVAAVGLAWPYSRFYESPDLLWLTPIVAFGAFLEGLNPTKLIRLQRRLELKRLVLINLVARVASIVVMVAWASAYRSPVALAMGSLSYAGFRLALAHAAIPGRSERLGWDREAFSSLVRFGKWIFVSTLISFLAVQLDTLLLGKLIPLTMLGVYGIGLMLIRLFREFTQALLSQVLFPALAEAWRAGPEELRASFLSSRQLVLRLGALIVLATLFGAPAFYEILYDERYHEAVWIAQLSLVGAWIIFLQSSAELTLLATGETEVLPWVSAARLVGAILGCGGGFYFFGLAGFVIGTAGGGAFGYVVVHIALRRHRLPIMRIDFPYSLLLVLIGLGGTASLFWIRQRWGVNASRTASFLGGVVFLSPIAAYLLQQVRQRLTR